MEESFWQTFCYHLALDYDYLMRFFHTWFSVRGLTKLVDVPHPPAPRIFVSVPLDGDKAWRASRRRLSIDSSLVSLGSSASDIDVRFEGSIAAGGSGHTSPGSCDRIRLVRAASKHRRRYSTTARVRSTPDIVRTIGGVRRRRRGGSESPSHSACHSPAHSSSSASGGDGGFFSSPGLCEADGRKGDSERQQMEAMRLQLAQMQRDIAQLVQQQQRQIQQQMQLQHTRSDAEATLAWDQESWSSLFQPIMASSPHHSSSAGTRRVSPPPPPCAPPPPPPTPVVWRTANVNASTSALQRAARREGCPTAQMANLLREMSHVKLRPVRMNNISAIETASNEIVFNPKLPLRSVTRHESIIADALRERFKQFRMAVEDDASADTSTATDEWCDDDAAAGGNASNSPHCNVARSLLRRVDRAMLPAVVSQDLLDDVAATGLC